jgi:hypothetical protein
MEHDHGVSFYQIMIHSTRCFLPSTAILRKPCPAWRNRCKSLTPFQKSRCAPTKPMFHPPLHLMQACYISENTRRSIRKPVNTCGCRLDDVETLQPFRTDLPPQHTLAILPGFGRGDGSGRLLLRHHAGTYRLPSYQALSG